MMISRRAWIGSFILAASLVTHAAAQSAGTATLRQGNGWIIRQTTHAYGDLLARLESAIKANKMGLVNAASASDGAKAQGITIPGNRVVGVFRNDFARRMLKASLQAGIEAPVRFYVTEGDDGKASLSYRTPSTVFAPYFDTAGPDLKVLAGELDTIFARILDDATR